MIYLPYPTVLHIDGKCCINCAVRLDENIGDSIVNLRELKNTARELNQIAHSNIHYEIQQRESQLDEKKPN